MHCKSLVHLFHRRRFSLRWLNSICKKVELRYQKQWNRFQPILNLFLTRFGILMRLVVAIFDSTCVKWKLQEIFSIIYHFWRFLTRVLGINSGHSPATYGVERDFVSKWFHWRDSIEKLGHEATLDLELVQEKTLSGYGI